MVFWKLEINKVSNSQVSPWVVPCSCTGQVKSRGKKDEGITVSAVALVMHVNEFRARRFWRRTWVQILTLNLSPESTAPPLMFYFFWRFCHTAQHGQTTRPELVSYSYNCMKNTHGKRFKWVSLAQFLNYSNRPIWHIKHATVKSLISHFFLCSEVWRVR